jgi:hypothetical protein
MMACDMKGTKTLVMNANIPDKQLKYFIIEVTNAPDSQVDGSDDYLALQYRRFFPTWGRDIQLFADVFSRLRDPNHPDPNNPLFQKEAGVILCRGVIRELRNRLRAVWLAEFDDVAEWRIRTLQLHTHRSTNFEDDRSKNLYPPSPETPIELAIDCVRRNLLMLRVCRNIDCPRPFFIASTAQDRFCSDGCVAIAQKSHKRRWWAKNRGTQPYKQQIQRRPTGEETMATSIDSGSATGLAGDSQVTEAPVNTRPGAKIVGRGRYRVSGLECERTLKRFLQNILNTSENRVDHLISAYPKFFPLQTRTEQLAARNIKMFSPSVSQEEVEAIVRKEKRDAFEQLRKGLQSIWNAEDPETARWRLFTLQADLHRSSELVLFRSDEELHQLHPPPADRLVNQALGFLGRNLRMLRTCSNPNCQTYRLFIASKRHQSYCSTLCTTLAQKGFKTRWWEEKGSEWRKARRKKISRKPERRNS